MQLQHERLSVFHRGVSLRQAGLAEPQALHLGAGQYETGFEGFEDEVIVAGTAILRDEALIRLVFSGHGRTLGERHLARISQARGNRGAEGGI